jgi:hypothetical protein
MDLHERFARGERARCLLADPAYQAVTRALQVGYSTDFFASRPSEYARRQDAYYQAKALGDIASELASWIEQGENAKAELERAAADNEPYDPLDYSEAD